MDTMVKSGVPHPSFAFFAKEGGDFDFLSESESI